MSDDSDDRTASLMTPAKLAQLTDRPKPAASPAAWLDQMAADAGSGHVRRLVELRAQLEAQVRERDYQLVRSAVGTLYEGLQKLDFAVLQPKGWLARATGRGKEQAAGFVAQYERMLRAGEDLADEVHGLQRTQQAQAGATDRALAELAVEVRALEKIMEQGTRWLQDMRNQLKAREAQGAAGAGQAQLKEDAARCELLVGRLKQLRAVVTAAQQATDRCKAAVGRRANLLENLQQLLEGDWKGWQQKLEPIATEAAATGAAAQGVERARTVHHDLRSSLKQSDRDLSQLQKQEQALADELAALHEPLQAAA